MSDCEDISRQAAPMGPYFTKDYLRSLRLLDGVDIDAIWSGLLRCERMCLEAGELLITPHSSCDAVYVVLFGSLRIHLRTLESEPVTSIPTGEGVGELSLFVDAPRSAFVVTKEDTWLLRIPRPVFWELLETSHRLTLNYLRMLSVRLRKNNDVVLESRALQRLYKQHAMTDGLTGLYNRRWFDQVYPRMFERSRQEKTPFSLVMLDIDFFKKFNDTYGHQAGDYALFMMGQVLKTHFRPTDIAARYGGEEFVVVMPHTTQEEALAASERVRLVVSQMELELPEGKKIPPITISLGIATLRDEEHPEVLHKKADEALYQAKNEGRNRSCCA
jgi:diguanylate cyclase (GGDEF)-like protein